MARKDTDADLLVTNALLVTCDSDHQIIENGALAVRDGRISQVLGAAGTRNINARRQIDAAGHIVMPGLVNMHCHAADSLFRGLVENLSLEDWLARLWQAEKSVLTPDTTYLGSLLGLAENLLAGTTTVMDMFWYLEQTAKAARQLGMRLAAGGIFFDLPGVGDRQHDDYLAEAEAFIQNWQGSEDIIPAIMPHGAYTVSPEHLADSISLADKYGVLFCVHAAETRAEQADIARRYGRSVIRHLDRLGCIGSRSVLAHCVHIDEGETELIASQRAIVAHNPMSNLKLGSGFAPTHKMLAAGIEIVLGTDGAVSGNDLDMFLAMRLAAMLPRGVTGQPDIMPAGRVVHMATLNAARALGREADLGSLEEGKQADFILLDCANLHSTPMFDPLTHIVCSASRKDVAAVFVAGRQLVENGQLLTFNTDDLRRDASGLIPSIRAALDQTA